ncbi:hypothetical protein BGZ49_006362 [Haplosporangium sp. Z 27]|nr:hypothetical protein BGZ49_006362 [Haplosporangium sp. Z 27]
MQTSLLKQEAIDSNHLYQTSLSSDEATEYSFTFPTSSRAMVELGQSVQMLQNDFNFYSNFTQQSATSSSPFQFGLSIPQTSMSSSSSHVYDNSSFEPMNFPLNSTVSSPETSSPSASSSTVSSPISTDFEEAMPNIAPVIACANCKRSHIKCDSGRPCQNCLKNPQKALTCRNAIPKPRGRPKGGSKAAAEAILQAKLQQQQQQLRAQQQSQYPRPRVVSLPQQHRPQLGMLQMHHPYHQQPQPQHRYFVSRSSPASPAASERRTIRYTRRPSLPAWHHHPYAVSNPMTSSMSAPVSSTLSSEMLYPLTTPVLSSTNQSLDAHHFLQDRLPIAGIQPHPVYANTMAMGPCPQRIQHELNQLQMMNQSSCGQLSAAVKSEPKEVEFFGVSTVTDHESGMLTLLQQKHEAQAELQRIQQRQQELQEQYQKRQALYNLKRQQQQQHLFC